MACMLWEDEFYESGVSIAKRITELLPQVDAATVADIAVRARNESKLRHVPLLIVREMARLPSHRHLVAYTLFNVIQRPDELGEFVSIYWKDKRQPLSAQVKKGLARAFGKFDAYQLGKYNREAKVTLRDVMFLVCPKPKDAQQAALFKSLADNSLAAPDTWEVRLSEGANKKDTFTRLINENRLGALALLRNLRGMQDAGVARETIVKGLESMNVERVLPFRFIAAKPYATAFEPQLEAAMFKCCAELPKLPGKTVLVVDTSGSMTGGNVSAKSDLTRVDAAKALAMLVREQCEDASIYATAGDDYARKHATMQVPARRGFALADLFFSEEMGRQIGGGGIFLKQCMDYIAEREKDVARVIVLTDEQDCDNKCSPEKAVALGKHNYIVNVSSYKNGIAYQKWTHINGWSEHVIEYILAAESQGLQLTGS